MQVSNVYWFLFSNECECMNLIWHFKHVGLDVWAYYKLRWRFNFRHPSFHLRLACIGCPIIIWTGLKIKIGIVQKVYEWWSCPLAKMIPLGGNRFGQRTVSSLIYFLIYAYLNTWPSVLNLCSPSTYTTRRRKVKNLLKTGVFEFVFFTRYVFEFFHYF